MRNVYGRCAGCSIANVLEWRICSRLAIDPLLVLVCDGSIMDGERGQRLLYWREGGNLAETRRFSLLDRGSSWSSCWRSARRGRRKRRRCLCHRRLGGGEERVDVHCAVDYWSTAGLCQEEDNRTSFNMAMVKIAESFELCRGLEDSNMAIDRSVCDSGTRRNVLLGRMRVLLSVSAYGDEPGSAAACRIACG